MYIQPTKASCYKRPSKADFISVYEELLFKNYEWAKDIYIRQGYMAEVIYSMYFHDGAWKPDGECAQEAWDMIGCDGIATIAKIRALR